MTHSSGISNSASSQKRSRRFSNDDAQAAVIYLFVVGMIAVLAVYIWMGPTMDAFTGFHNNATQGAGAFLPISQDRQDAIFVTQLAFRDYPLIAFIIMIISSVVATLKWRTSNV